MAWGENDAEKLSWGKIAIIEKFHFKIAVNPLDGYIKGDITLDVKRKCPYLQLDKGFEIKELIVNKDSGEWENINYERKGASVSLRNLSERTKKIRIIYEGKVDYTKETHRYDKTEGSIRTTATPSFGQFMSVDDFWYPYDFLLFHEPKESIIEISVPEEYNIIATGELVEEKVNNGLKTSVWKIGSGMRKGSFSFFYSKTHKCYSRKDRDLTYEFFLNPENAAWVDILTDKISNIIRFYSDNFYCYPYKKFALVSSSLLPSRWGLGKFSEFVIIASDIFDFYERLSKDELEFKIYSFLGHEIGHQWWYLTNPINNVLFSEGMPQLFSLLALENQMGEKEVQKYKNVCLMEMKKFFESGKEDFPLVEDTPSNHMKKPEYQISAKYLQIFKFPLYMIKLRNIIGKESFLKAIKDFTSNGIGGMICDFETTYKEYVNQLNIPDKQKEETEKIFDMNCQTFENSFKKYTTDKQRRILKDLFYVRFPSFEAFETYINNLNAY